MKKEFKDTKFAAFLDKVIPVLGDTANAALKIAKGDFAGAVGDVVGIFNKENDIMMILTGSVGLASFGGIVLAVIFMPHLEESNLFNQLMGFVFGVAVSNIFAFYFGTSKSSQDKTKLMAR